MQDHTDDAGLGRDQGFNLIELLLVIVILGMIATVVVVSVGGLRAEAEDSACVADRRLLEKAGGAYFAQQGVDAIPAAIGATSDEYEQTLVDEEFLRGTSIYYDLDAAGELVEVAGSPCSI